MDALTAYFSSLPFSIIISVLASIAAFFLIPVIIRGRRENWRNSPPGPVGWPILGSLPYLSNRLHEDFFNLSKIYGPIMSLNLGLKPAIVVTSPEMAQEVLKIKEGSISSRTITEAIRAISYDAHGVIFSPYGARWKVLRRILISELLSPKAFESFEPLRRQQVHSLLRQLYSISKSNTQVNISEAAFVALLNLVSNIIVSKNLFDSSKKDGGQLKEMFWEMIKVLGTPNTADLIPILKPLDPQRLKTRIANLFKRMDAFYEKLIAERMKERENHEINNTKKSGRRDLLDVLLDYRSDDKENNLDRLHRNIIKAMISELFMGATETTSSTVEWGMTEILRKPHVHKQLVAELDQVIGKDRFVEESDIPNLPYLQATVKEVFRLHPGVPMIIPRRTNESCEVGGYQVPKHCVVYVNVWGIARDPKVWEDPYEFKPERFIGSSVDVKGQDFNLLPFGSGRRSCVGWPLAHRMMHFYLATMLHAFDWVSPPEIVNDVTERVGLTLQKDKNLLATPTPRLPESVYQY
ncbi:hypothetical protein ACOSQ2_021853 [Xanthoceras sorbifolium]